MSPLVLDDRGPGTGDRGPLKVCSCCQRSYTRATWNALPFVGVQAFDYEPDDPEQTRSEMLETRNCEGCGSTLALSLGTEGDVLALVRRALVEHGALLDALRRVQARCTELKEENRRLRAERQEWTVENNRDGVSIARPLGSSLVGSTFAFGENARITGLSDELVILHRRLRNGDTIRAGDKLVQWSGDCLMLEDP